MAKQFQNRPGHRAPHGAPDYSGRVGAWVTEAQRKKFLRNGGSAWLRGLINSAKDKAP